MKRFVIGTVFVLAIPAIGFTNTFFGSAAYAENSNRSNKGACQSIPPARPTGGGTRERIAAMNNRCLALHQQNNLARHLKYQPSKIKSQIVLSNHRHQGR
jgi:hypothetical protein